MNHMSICTAFDILPISTGSVNRDNSDLNRFINQDEKWYPKERTNFCTKENILNSIAYINQEFQLLGLPCLQYDGVKSNLDAVFLMNRIYDLLSIYHKTKFIKEDLENKNHRLLCDVERQKSTNFRLSKNQDQANKDFDEEKEKLRQITLKYKQMCAKLKVEKEDVKRLTAVVQSRDVQFKHEQKKKEQELQKLKERLHQLLSDKVPDRKVGMELQNVLGRNEGRRSTWKSSSGKQEEEMYHLLISNYEERNKELMVENGELRDCLLSLQRELTVLIKCTENKPLSSLAEEKNTDSMSASQRISELDEGYFQMPYDIIRHDIQKIFKETCSHIFESIKRSSLSNEGKISTTASPKVNIQCHEGTSQPSDTLELESLKRKIKKYKSIIQQQEELIQQSFSSHSHSVKNTLQLESQLFKEKDSLSEQRKSLIQEKANFEKEKLALKEAVVKFGQEKRQFQDEKTNILKNQLFMIPLLENQRMSSNGSSNHSPRLLPATPAFSAKSSGRVQLEGCDDLLTLVGTSHSSRSSDSSVNP